jgi:alpha-amylase
MNWQDVTGKAGVNRRPLANLGQFRARHPAIGEGKQTTLSLKEGYGFVREHNGDKVMVVWAGNQ